MKTILKTTLILSLLISSAAFAAKLKIDVSKINGEKGEIGIAIFSQKHASSFPDEDKFAYHRAFVKLDELPYEVEVDDNTKYAVTLFLDKNSDMKLNTKGLLGIPSEPFGFSNNPTLYFGPPSFSKASVRVKTGTKSVNVALKRY